jgi:hypothetical protein
MESEKYIARGGGVYGRSQLAGLPGTPQISTLLKVDQAAK